MQNPSFTKIIGTFNLINISTFLIPKHNKFLLFKTNSNCFIVTFFKICSVAFFNYFHFEGFTIIHIVILSFLQAKMKIDIQALYESLLVGSCPCHGFTKVEGHSGWILSYCLSSWGMGILFTDYYYSSLIYNKHLAFL